jgi:hypothetical protein
LEGKVISLATVHVRDLLHRDMLRIHALRHDRFHRKQGSDLADGRPEKTGAQITEPL